MERQDKQFFITFLATLTILVFLLRGTITGQVIQTAYCDDTGCYEFCKTHSDCSLGETCCQEKDFGICKSDCEEEYVFNPNFDIEYPPQTEQPVEMEESNNLLYLFLIFITLVIGGLYFFLRNKHIHVKF